ncbi:glycosyltransferase [Shewanella algae]|uniref:glycosyltransferase n=1 Tax=Shewanella algae TaxID=38313 RepID=UPI0031F49EC8
MEPLVSILIPVFNHSKFVLDCLNSMLTIDYQNIELVICDDGSTDDSYSKVKTWLESNSSVRAKLFTQENQGVCKTLNRLIKESSGEYLALCASDDCLTPDSIKLRVLALQQHPNKLAVIGDALLIDQESNVIARSAMKYLYKTNYYRLQTDLISELIFRWSVVGPSLLINKDAYNQIGLYDEGLRVEDRDFYLRLLKENNLIFIPEIVSCYRIHTGNASRKSKAARLVVFKDVAVSNYKHAGSFTGLKKAFLLSHKVDLLVLDKTKTFITYRLLFVIRGLRYCIFNIIRFISKNKHS